MISKLLTLYAYEGYNEQLKFLKSLDISQPTIQ